VTTERPLPPYFSTGDAGSFARHTLQVRKPAIIDKIVAANDFNTRQEAAMASLKREVLSGVITDPLRDSPEVKALDDESHAMWRETIPRYSGRSWLDVPFYFAEAYLYFRILFAIGYYDPDSSFFMKDPYQPFKEHELCSENGGLAIGRMLLENLERIDDPVKALQAILYNSLWGNRVDLSLFSIAEKSRNRVLDERDENLLIDHSGRVAECIEDAKRVDFILDNTGQELVSDLIAVWYILSLSPRKRILLHAKRYPFYVSDAMIKDIDATIDALGKDGHGLVRRVGEDLCAFLKQERVSVTEHYFWNGPLHYPELPKELRRELSRSDMVLLKGDINYRRMVSDRRWDVSADLEEIAAHFPSSFALLRTMKSEAVVDIDVETAALLQQQDPEWKYNGDRGIIRLVCRGK
jgi:uncharacterized protein with ATP-grasp and redox domains